MLEDGLAEVDVFITETNFEDCNDVLGAKYLKIKNSVSFIV